LAASRSMAWSSVGVRSKTPWSSVGCGRTGRTDPALLAKARPTACCASTPRCAPLPSHRPNCARRRLSAKNGCPPRRPRARTAERWIWVETDTRGLPLLNRSPLPLVV